VGTQEFTGWWLKRPMDTIDWLVPISSFQRFRPVGGYLMGSAGLIEFVPNRFEAMVGGRAWRAPIDDIEKIVMQRRRLRIMSPNGNQTLLTHRPQAVRRHLGHLVETD
jgi:hypothetical protein